MPLPIHSAAPDFSLPSTSGQTFTLSIDQHGKPCVIYFYPKDFTDVCTKEACEFRDQFAEFRDLDIDILGISRDDIPTHLRFKAAHKLPFELLADTSGKVAKTYDAKIPIIGLTKRITYLLDAQHRIVAAFQDMFGSANHIQAMIDGMKAEGMKK